MSQPRIFPLGDAALVCEAPPPATLECQQRVWAAAEAARDWPHVLEVVPGMNNLTLVFDSLEADREALGGLAASSLERGGRSCPRRAVKSKFRCNTAASSAPICKRSPNHTGLSVREVVQRHADGEYVVFFLGFQPGFAYMGGLEAALHTPRRASPRLEVPAGSVGIGGEQTGIYPATSPGRLAVDRPHRTAAVRSGSPSAHAIATGRPGALYRRGDTRMIDVIRAGLLTTIQDLGRHGYRHLGVAMGGALDRLSLEVGNRLVGNRPDAAGLEITFGPTVLRFLRATRVAITGTEFGATLDGKPVYSWWSLPVQAGQELVLQAAKRGMRGYVCIAGGIDVLPMLGSRSTDLAGHFGGLGGRALRDGDRLPVGAPPQRGHLGFTPEAPEFGVKAPAWCKFVLVHEPLRRGRHPSGVPWAVPIRVLQGPEYDSFTEDSAANRSGPMNGWSHRTAIAWAIASPVRN